MAKELHDQLADELLRLERNTQRILLKSLNSVSAEIVDRIHTDGQAATGGKIGSYSTKPISISKRNQARNTGKTFFKGGYKEYKQKIGFSGGVNLENTGQMRQDWGVIPINRNTGALGFRNQHNANKSGWLEQKYGKSIYDTTKKEDDLFDRVFDAESRKYVK